MNEPSEWIWTPLPPKHNVETTAVLKKALEAQQYISELKGISLTIPNREILLNTLPMQEARDSSEIENIVTTSDALFKAEVTGGKKVDHVTKEVQRYAKALRVGLNAIQTDGFLATRHIVEVQGVLENNEAGIRRQPGTKLTNPATGEVVFVPPQDRQVIEEALRNLEQYINDDGISGIHPLIRMAIIHYQFESIHPFYDGNGRTGRILNMLYLVHRKLLDLPILYLSKYIVRNKEAYYELLQRVRTEEDWESWILYMLTGVTETSKQSISVITNIRELMMDYKHRIRLNHSFYSQDLINHLFKHPYSKINFLKEELGVSRQTATKYLDELTESGFLEKEKQGRDNYYFNRELLAVIRGER